MSETTTIEITGAAHGGEGIGRIDGLVCFVAGALPGDTVRAHIVRRAKNAVWGEVDAVLTPSPARIPDAAPHSGADSWIHFAYPAQAEWKQRIASEQLRRLGGIELDLEWREMPELRLGYRTRAEFHGDGERFGFFARGSHDIVDTESCALCHPKLNEALAILRTLRLKGSVTVTVNPEGEEVLVWTAFAKRTLKNAFSDANSPQDARRSMFLFDGLPVVNGCFSQASLLLNRLLLETVRGLSGAPKTMLDLYCGSGNLSLEHARAGCAVTGFDHNKSAVEAARAIAGNYQAGGEDRMSQAISDKRWDLILLDPPRTGAKELLKALSKADCGTMVYVSCDPATLARDLKALTAAGWQVERAIALDLFPHTPHVETVCKLKR